MKIFAVIFLFAFSVVAFFSCKSSQTSSSSSSANTNAEVHDAKPVTIDLSPFRKVPEKTSSVAGDKNTDKVTSTGTENVKNNPSDLPKNNKPASSALTGHQNDKIEEKASEAALFNASITEARGFRLQLYSGGDREEAEKILRKAKSHVPASENPMLVYEQPNYKIKVGNFINKIEAYQLMTNLQKEFSGVLIVTDLIDLDVLRKKYRKN